MNLLLLALLLAGSAAAAGPESPGMEVLERDAKGNATKVKSDGIVYDVCTPERTDGCVNPREIGLDQGNRAIDYWPGKPASEIDQPLPVDKSGSSQGGTKTE